MTGAPKGYRLKDFYARIYIIDGADAHLDVAKVLSKHIRDRFGTRPLASLSEIEIDRDVCHRATVYSTYGQAYVRNGRGR